MSPFLSVKLTRTTLAYLSLTVPLLFFQTLLALNEQGEMFFYKRYIQDCTGTTSSTKTVLTKLTREKSKYGKICDRNWTYLSLKKCSLKNTSKTSTLWVKALRWKVSRTKGLRSKHRSSPCIFPVVESTRISLCFCYYLHTLTHCGSFDIYRWRTLVYRLETLTSCEILDCRRLHYTLMVSARQSKIWSMIYDHF